MARNCDRDLTFDIVIALLDINKTRRKGHVDVTSVYRIQASHWSFHLASIYTQQLPIINLSIIETLQKYLVFNIFVTTKILNNDFESGLSSP